jgi:hypothetical protein
MPCFPTKCPRNPTCDATLLSKHYDPTVAHFPVTPNSWEFGMPNKDNHTTRSMFAVEDC